MEFKVTAGEVLAAEGSIIELSKVKMRGAYGISVARLLKSIKRKADKIREDRLELAKKHGEKQADGKYKLRDGHELDLEKDGKSLIESEVSVSGPPLPRGISDIETEPKIWVHLLPFLQEEVDRKEKEGE